MAHDNLPPCLTVTLAEEGGFSDDPRDAGNWTGGKRGVGVLKGTNMGIAASAHPDLDIRHLTRAQVEAIYKGQYWNKAGCEVLPAGLDLQHFDGTVNSGVGHSAGWLETAMKATTAVGRVHAYSDARLTSLKSWKVWLTFGKSLAGRIARVEAKAVAMAAGPAAAPAAIAAAGDKASAKAKVHGLAAHAGTGAAVGGVAVAASAHPALGGALAIAGVLTAIFNAFHASTSGARAATLHAAGA